MKSTFSRTFATLAVILLVALLLVGIIFQYLVKDYLTDTTVEGLKKDGEVIVDLVQAIHDQDPISRRDFSVALSIATSVSGADAVICNENGTLILCADSPMGCEHQGMVVDSDYLEHVFRSGCSVSTGLIRGLYSDARYVVALPVLAENGSRLGIVIVSSPMNETARIMTQISRLFLTVCLSVIVFSVILTTLFARKHSQPLKQMADMARSFGHGDLSARVKTNGKCAKEVEELALAFNNMASSLEKSEYQRQEFVANVSHELKTPMTTISGYIDGILDGTIPEQKRDYYLRIVSDETKRLNRLVRSMLDISRLQDRGGIPEEQKTRFDMEECAGQVLITFEQKINEKDLQVQVDMPEHPVYTMASQDAITQVVYNLVDNAVKFCPQGGAISLTVREGGGKIYVSVANDGETIPPEELHLVFDRFHKIDKSRSRNRDSWGLGLYIVKTLICSHGENISVTSREGKTTFTFTLPLVN